MTLPLYVHVFLAMLAHAPVERLPQFPGHVETLPQQLARYGEIAAAITDVCEGESRTPRDCAALLVALAWGESGFARDADVGPCRNDGAYRSRCDGGRAASVWQAHAYGADDAGPITVERLFADRRLAARQALRAARGSLRMCRHLAPEDRLAALGGTCTPGKSQRARYRAWMTLRAWSQPK